MDQEKHRPWRRWVVLVLMIVGFILGGIFVPIQPEITAAPEKLIEEPLFTLPVIGDFYLVNTLPTLAVTVFIVIPLLAYFTNRSLTKSAQTDLVSRGIGNLMESILEILYNMTEGAAGKWVRVIFPWFATLMIYVLLANLLKLIPGFESIGVLHHTEAEGHAIAPLFGSWALLTPEDGEYILAPFLRGISVDLNFTFALALVAVVAVQVVGFRAQGAGYLQKFFNFGNIFKKPVFGVIDMFMGLLELVSELSRVLSFAFRLFGNMFAGIVLVAVVGSLLGRFSIVPAMIFMFELFVGLIQAFVFGILTMVFMVMATQGHGEEHAEH